MKALLVLDLMAKLQDIFIGTQCWIMWIATDINK